MNLIAAVDADYGLGRGNKLLVHLPKDLHFFKEQTTGKVLVLGRKTLESFKGGKPLPNRTHIVLSRNPAYAPEGVAVVHSLEELLAAVAAYPAEDVFVAGGGDIYQQLLPYCDTLYLTRIDRRFEADTRLMGLEELEADFRLEWESGAQEEKGITYHWQIWKRL